MSKKYISQINSLDFVYPNNFTAEYDLEIVHDINDNCVSGTTTVFSATTINSTGITFNIQGSWSLNSAEPYININGGFLSVASIHMMGPTQSYYRPWRLVDNISSTGLTNTNISFNENFTVLPSYLGLTGFTTGTYYFEVRLIGKKCVYPICITLPITVSPPSTPTPTPTVTPTSTPGLSPTPTPTPTPTATSGGGTSSWTVSNYDCGGGTLNDVGINSSFMNSLEGPSNFPLTSGLYGNKTNPNGILYGTGFTNTIQFNVTTGIAGVGNCAVVRIEINSGERIYETYFTTNPYPQITGVVINPLDSVTAYVECYVGPCP